MNIVRLIGHLLNDEIEVITWEVGKRRPRVFAEWHYLDHSQGLVLQVPLDKSVNRNAFRGMSAKALADAAGISAPYLSQLEGGVREGSIDAMKKLADALKVTIDELV